MATMIFLEKRKKKTHRVFVRHLRINQPKPKHPSTNPERLPAPSTYNHYSERCGRHRVTDLLSLAHRRAHTGPQRGSCPEEDRGWEPSAAAPGPARLSRGGRTDEGLKREARGRLHLPAGGSGAGAAALPVEPAERELARSIKPEAAGRAWGPSRGAAAEARPRGGGDGGRGDPGLPPPRRPRSGEPPPAAPPAHRRSQPGPAGPGLAPGVPPGRPPAAALPSALPREAAGAMFPLRGRPALPVTSAATCGPGTAAGGGRPRPERQRLRRLRPARSRAFIPARQRSHTSQALARPHPSAAGIPGG